MLLIHRLRQWYIFQYGRGKTMRDHGATLLPCPHCGNETPVYHSSYDTAGNPIDFSVCLWCEGLIEYSGMTTDPHEPYASAKDVQQTRAMK
jgi:hypothetical protein